MLLWNVLEGHQTRSYDQAVAALEDWLSMEGHKELSDHFKYGDRGEMLFKAF